MKTLFRFSALLIFSIIFACLFFVGTSLIDRHGPPVKGWQYAGEAPYRHAAGVPFIFLERSLPDGVWQPQPAYPGYAPSGHVLSVPYLLVDMGIWLIVAGLIVVGLCIVFKPFARNQRGGEPYPRQYGDQ